MYLVPFSFPLTLIIAKTLKSSSSSSYPSTHLQWVLEDSCGCLKLSDPPTTLTKARPFSTFNSTAGGQHTYNFKTRHLRPSFDEFTETSFSSTCHVLRQQAPTSTLSERPASQRRHHNQVIHAISKWFRNNNVCRFGRQVGIY